MRHLIAVSWLVVAGFSFAAFLAAHDVEFPLAVVAWVAWLIGLSTTLKVAEETR